VAFVVDDPRGEQGTKQSLFSKHSGNHITSVVTTAKATVAANAAPIPHGNDADIPPASNIAAAPDAAPKKTSVFSKISSSRLGAVVEATTSTQASSESDKINDTNSSPVLKTMPTPVAKSIPHSTTTLSPSTNANIGAAPPPLHLPVAASMTTVDKVAPVPPTKSPLFSSSSPIPNTAESSPVALSPLPPLQPLFASTPLLTPNASQPVPPLAVISETDVVISLRQRVQTLEALLNSAAVTELTLRKDKAVLEGRLKLTATPPSQVLLTLQEENQMLETKLQASEQQVVELQAELKIWVLSFLL
jgi:hypothetical protein